MSDAERQRRHRRKVAKERREAELAIKRQQNWEKLNDPVRQARFAERQAEREAIARLQYEHSIRIPKPPLPDASGPADELAHQIDEFLMDTGISIADVRAAIDRRFGPKR